MSLIPPSATLAAKRILRARALARRAALTPPERAEASARIRETLFALPAFHQARTVHAFISFPEEVDTAPILAACRKAQKSIVLPYQVPGGERLGHACWIPGQALVPGPFGTQEPPPEARQPLDLASIDLVLVPGVAFDRRGGRLGYGKGYYDRFLADLLRCSGSPPALVALAFSAQIVEAVPLNAWDVRVPQLLTERGLHTVAPAAH